MKKAKRINLTMTAEMKKTILKGINIRQVFSNKVLDGLTETIIDDEYFNLYTRADWEIIKFFGQEWDLTNYEKWTEYQKELFLEHQSREVGLKSLEFSVYDWDGAFYDYIEGENGAEEEFNAFMDSLEGTKLSIKMD